MLKKVIDITTAKAIALYAAVAVVILLAIDMDPQMVIVIALFVI
jgi:hypothetical protein